METATKQVEAPAVGSDLSGNTSAVSSSLHGTGGRKENFTRIDRKLYKAAVEGKFEDFAKVQNIEKLLTPNKNRVLHIHLTSQTTKGVSTRFVEQILDQCGGLVLQPNAKGETPLHMAARYGHSSIAKLLIESRFHQDIENGIGAERKQAFRQESELIGATNCENDTALHEAVRYDHFEVVKILLEMDPHHAYSANNANETPLYLASERQYKVMVNKMLEVLKSPAYDGPNGRTALHAAVINRDIDMAEYLLKNKHLRAAVKHADEKGWVPLHYAVKIGDKDLVKLLLEKDENTAYMQDNEGRTALHIAAYCNHLIIMKMIIEYYPDCSELVDNKGWNALHYAVNGEGFSAVAKISKNLALSNLYNEKDVDGNTPLHHLATSNSTNTSFVFDRRVDKHARNKKGHTALDVAYANPNDTDILINQDIINALKDAGARRSGQHLYLNSEAKQEKNQQLMNSAKEGESSLIVATLIATVSFAAAITLPGGTIQDGERKGSPILGERASFKAFIVSNTIALVLSASAAFIRLFSPMEQQPSFPHLSSSTYQLLSKAAFSFTLLAVTAMIVAFSTATYAVLGTSPVGIAVLIIALSFFLVYGHVIRMWSRAGFRQFFRDAADVIVFSLVGAKIAYKLMLYILFNLLILLFKLLILLFKLFPPKCISID